MLRDDAFRLAAAYSAANHPGRVLDWKNAKLVGSASDLKVVSYGFEAGPCWVIPVRESGRGILRATPVVLVHAERRTVATGSIGE